MSLLDTVREEAAKTYKTEAELNSFMEGFQKEASLMGIDGIGGMALKAGFGLAAGLAGAGIVKGITATSSAITNNALRTKFEFALTSVINSNKIVKGANPTKVKSYADTLFSFAPHVASDVNMLSTLLTNAVHGEGVDASILKSITDLEGRYRENNSPSPLIGIRT
jgi:hypothetical protein